MKLQNRVSAKVSLHFREPDSSSRYWMRSKRQICGCCEIQLQLASSASKEASSDLPVSTSLQVRDNEYGNAKRRELGTFQTSAASVTNCSSKMMRSD